MQLLNKQNLNIIFEIDYIISNENTFENKLIKKQQV